jgi:hypothetical protein
LYIHDARLSPQQTDPPGCLVSEDRVGS